MMFKTFQKYPLLATHLALGACLFAPAALAREDRAPQHVPGELIVKLRHAQSSSSLQSLRSLIDTDFEEARPLLGDPSWVKVRLGSDLLLEPARRHLMASPETEYAEPNYLYSAIGGRLRDSVTGQPNDPLFDRLWHLHNPSAPGADIDVLKAWAAGSTGSREVIVAVIDTGIEWDHPDLKPNLYTNPGEAGPLSENGIDDDANGRIDDVHGWNFVANTRDSGDDHGHGTHCAGLIGARGDDGAGSVGVNWNVTLLPLKFLDANGSGTLEGAIEAVLYAIHMKAHVLSNSWGGGTFSLALLEVIRKAGSQGMVFVASAGNSSINTDQKPSYPASYNEPNVISVAATDSKNELASFSNRGAATVHLAAPGVEILSTELAGSHQVMSGTSMACPQVSGIAALLLSENPLLKPSELRERLIRTSNPVPALVGKVRAGGTVSAWRALRDIRQPTPTPGSDAPWEETPYHLESMHPYLNNFSQQYELRVEGAKFIRVVFDKISTHERFDFVSVSDCIGAVVETYTGSQGDVVTPVIAGDTALITVHSDSTDYGWGFSVSRVQVIR